jgi:hypothetical protein
MTDLSREREEWSGYKRATFIVSLVSILVIVGQAVYNNFYVERWKRIEYLSAERQRLKTEIEKRQAVPKLRIKVTTLAKVGLSEQMLRQLSAVPSSIELVHAGGGTLRGVLVEVISKASITQYYKWEGHERFDVIPEKGDRTKLRLDVPQLRSGASVGVTILTNRVPDLTARGVVDVGELLEDPTRSEQAATEGVFSAMALERFVSPFGARLRERRFDRREAQLEDLDREIAQLKDMTLFAWLAPTGVVGAFLLMVGSISVAATVIILPDYLKDRRKRDSGRRFLQELAAGEFDRADVATVLSRLGTPDDIGSTLGGPLRLVYFKAFNLMRSRKGVTLSFRNDVLEAVHDDEGRQLLRSAGADTAKTSRIDAV